MLYQVLVFLVDPSVFGNEISDRAHEVLTAAFLHKPAVPPHVPEDPDDDGAQQCL